MTLRFAGRVVTFAFAFARSDSGLKNYARADNRSLVFSQRSETRSR